MREVCVYLSGGFHTQWRKKVMEACKGLPIRFLDPLSKEVGKDGLWKNIHLTDHEKEERDKTRVQSPWWGCDKLAFKIADIIFVNFEDYGWEEGKLRGTGDVFEAGMGYMADKLVIVVNQVEHRYFREFERLFTSFRYLDEGIAFLKEKCSWLTR